MDDCHSPNTTRQSYVTQRPREVKFGPGRYVDGVARYSFVG